MSILQQVQEILKPSTQNPQKRAPIEGEVNGSVAWLFPEINDPSFERTTNDAIMRRFRERIADRENSDDEAKA